MHALEVKLPTQKTKPYDVLMYWMREREHVWTQKISGAQKPWTTDPILQSYRFCNVFRTKDTVTQHYVEWIKQVEEPMHVVFNTGLYRLINWPETMDEIGPVKKFFKSTMIAKMEERARQKKKVFTGAYIIPNVGKKEPKIQLVVNACHKWWKDKLTIANQILEKGTLKHAWSLLRATNPIVGGFLAYEIVTDLSYNLLNSAPDLKIWAHAGPGAKRGLNRLAGRFLSQQVKDQTALLEMRMLYAKLSNELEWDLSMREVEHSLCEFDKYMRVLYGEGRPRSKYNGKG